MTKTEALACGLTANGYIEVPTASKVYRCFRHPDDVTDNKMWLGRSGALRHGETARDGLSLSRSARARRLEAAGRAA